MILRDMSLSVNGLVDSTDPRVGVLGGEIPRGGDFPAFLLNDIDEEFPDRLYSLQVLTPPSAGELYLDKASGGYFRNAPDGIYNGTQRVEKFDPGVGRVSSVTSTYTLRVGQPTVSAVTVSPSSASGSQQFTATVIGENSPSQSVTWSLEGAGSISVSGYFTEPPKTDVEQFVVIKATSTLDNTKYGTATVFIPAIVIVEPPAPVVNDVAVSPENAVINGGNQLQFYADVIGVGEIPQSVTWKVTLGSINEDGLLTVPSATLFEQVGTVEATSTLDTTKSGTATFTVPALVVVDPPIDPPIDTSGAPGIFASTIMSVEDIYLSTVMI